MKLTTKIIAGAAALAFLTMTAGSAQAQVTNVITLTITALAQGSSTDKSGVTTTASPTKHSIVTSTILGWLAQDENAEGNYGSATFPTGAKLVVVTGNNSNGDFQVLDKNNNLLVDVSDIITGTDGSLGNDIYSGKQNDLTGLASTSETDLHVLTIAYDDSNEIVVSGSTVGVQFYMTGLMTSTTSDTVPNATTKVYTESKSNSLASGTGEGNYQNQPFVLTGTLSASGKATLTLP